MLKSAEERAFIKRDDQLKLGIVPRARSASQGARALPCLWLCFHEALPALLLDQKTGDWKGAWGTRRTRKREAVIEQGFLQVAPGSSTLVRAVDG